MSTAVADPEEYPPKPDKPCPVCGSTDWWYREPSFLGGKGEWVCGHCHPRPNEGNE